MPSLNKVVLIGRLTRDPELRYTAGGLAVTSFSIAVDRRFKNQQGERVTDFFRCKAWRQKAEFVANYVTKGRLVAVEGSIEISEVPGQDGQRRTFVDIVCENVEILESARDGGGGMAAEGGAPRGGNRAPTADEGGFYPEEDAAPPLPQGGGFGAAGMRSQAGSAGGGAPQRPPQGGAPHQGGAPAARRAPEPSFPAADDFDDSDPFADE